MLQQKSIILLYIIESYKFFNSQKMFLLINVDNQTYH